MLMLAHFMQPAAEKPLTSRQDFLKCCSVYRSILAAALNMKLHSAHRREDEELSTLYI